MINIVAAVGKNLELGKDGGLIFDIPNDLKYFKKLTLGHTVVMGRRTYESIGHPLPNRTNVVISSNGNYSGVYNFKSLEDAIKCFGDKDIYISGGSKLYKESLSYVDRMYITVIDKYMDGDTYFPKFNKDNFNISSREYIYDSVIPYCRIVYNRRELNKTLKKKNNL